MLQSLINKALKTFDKNLKEERFEFIDKKSIEKFLYRLIDGEIKNEIKNKRDEKSGKNSATYYLKNLKLLLKYLAKKH